MCSEVHRHVFRHVRADMSHIRFCSVAFSRSGRRVACGCRDGTLRIINTASGKVWANVCVDMCRDMYIDTCIDLSTDMCVDTCIDICIYLWVDIYMGRAARAGHTCLCMDMRIDTPHKCVCRHLCMHMSYARARTCMHVWMRRCTVCAQRSTRISVAYLRKRTSLFMSIRMINHTPRHSAINARLGYHSSHGIKHMRQGAHFPMHMSVYVSIYRQIPTHVSMTCLHTHKVMSLK